MGKCLDFKSCGFNNRDKARFCARCGIPTRDTRLQERYEIQILINRIAEQLPYRPWITHNNLSVRALILQGYQ